jgi:hypothetical protein
VRSSFEASGFDSLDGRHACTSHSLHQRSQVFCSWLHRYVLAAQECSVVPAGAGAPGLMVVVIAHVCEELRVFPCMGWGEERGIGYHLALTNAALGVILFPVGYLIQAMGKLDPTDEYCPRFAQALDHSFAATARGAICGGSCCVPALLLHRQGSERRSQRAKGGTTNASSTVIGCGNTSLSSARPRSTAGLAAI